MMRDAKARPNRLLRAPARRAMTWDDADASDVAQPLDGSSVISRQRGVARVLIAFKVLWSLAIVLGSALGLAWGVYRYATTSARFAVKDVVAQGFSRLSKEQVLAESGIRLGENLFKLDLALVERRLLRNPWVAQVRVARRLPSSVDIEIQEREAAALALVLGQLFLVNRQGETFKPVTPQDPTDLPLITGIAVEDGPRDTSLYRQRIALGLDVLSHYSQSRLAKSYQPQEVHLTPGGEAIMTLGHKGTTLHLGTGPWSSKFVMAERVLARLQAQRSSPAIVFMDNRANPNRVVVRVN